MLLLISDTLKFFRELIQKQVLFKKKVWLFPQFAYSNNAHNVLEEKYCKNSKNCQFVKYR